MTRVHTYFSLSDGRPDVAFLDNGDATVTVSLAFLDTLMLGNNMARDY